MEERKKAIWGAVVGIQLIYAGYFLLTKIAFDVGMNTFVFVFYRQFAATLFLAPFAFSLQRKSAPPPLTFSIFIKIFLLSLFGYIYVLHGRVLKEYPSKLLLTTLQCFLSTIQSFIVAASVTRDPHQWLLGWNIRLLSVAYCGIVVTGLTFYLQTWVIEKKGPVFLAMTTPLIMVFTIILSAFFLGEIISFGSVLGAILLVGGLYFVLLGKAKEEEMEKTSASCQTQFCDVEKGTKEVINSTPQG
ncbi:PREDICTED: WAT1-related protein At5g64700-like [Erythranthe guttata]|nr:PREDICTED: WAT1-related protein At5g64700-like [Erythranthe guttata]|eukprot:XP_012844955.1 PREDICTED: WAT1-related protein At5g64700-like [Erythranthe guttata]